MLPKHNYYDTGYTVDVKKLLCRHLIRNKLRGGKKVCVDHLLKGKTILLYIAPINYDHVNFSPDGDTMDMIQAYHELLPLGGIEFVLVPVYIPRRDGCYTEQVDGLARFNDLLSAVPFPSVPFSDVRVCGDRVLETFSVPLCYPTVSYWVIIDPTSTVVATRYQYCFLFKLFGGAELYPLSHHSITSLLYDFDPHDLADLDESSYCRATDSNVHLESRKRLIHRWDQLLESPARDFLLSPNGARVPISSLKGKAIGLYFCENIPCPPRMHLIKEAYRDARSRGYDFEIVQINYHYQILNHSYSYAQTTDFSVQQCHEDIDWLTLPFGDPSCRKLQRIFKCKFDIHCTEWMGDCLVIIDDSRVHYNNIFFEFSGAEIISNYGIDAFPFTRQSLYKAEYTRLKKEVKLQLLFPPGLCQFIRPAAAGGFDLVSDSQLKGKRVLVLLGDVFNDLLPLLKSKYRERAEEDKFELVSYDYYDESDVIPDVPWLVHPYSEKLTWGIRQIFKSYYLYRSVGFVAFDIDGELIYRRIFNISPDKFEQQSFPFLRGDLKRSIRKDLGHPCSLGAYYGQVDT